MKPSLLSDFFPAILEKLNVLFDFATCPRIRDSLIRYCRSCPSTNLAARDKNSRTDTKSLVTYSRAPHLHRSSLDSYLFSLYLPVPTAFPGPAGTMDSRELNIGTRWRMREYVFAGHCCGKDSVTKGCGLICFELTPQNGLTNTDKMDQGHAAPLDIYDERIRIWECT